MREHDNSDYKRLIHSRRWLLLRRRYAAAHPLCEECLKRGILDSRTEQVHHRTPVTRGRTWQEMERLAFDESNLEAVCRQCHRRLHRELEGNIGQGSPEVRDWLRVKFGL